MHKIDINNLPPGARYFPDINNLNDAMGDNVEKMTALNKVKSFTIAMTSKLLQPKASRVQQRARLAVCRGCDAFQPTNDKLIGFCGACGCGSHKLASLLVKSKILYSTCPKQKWDIDPKAVALPLLNDPPVAPAP